MPNSQTGSDRKFSLPDFIKMIKVINVITTTKSDHLAHLSLRTGSIWWDRFSRSREDAVIYKGLLCHDLGVEIISVKEPVDDPDSPLAIYPKALTK